MSALSLSLSRYLLFKILGKSGIFSSQVNVRDKQSASFFSYHMSFLPVGEGGKHGTNEDMVQGEYECEGEGARRAQLLKIP